MSKAITSEKTREKAAFDVECTLSGNETRRSDKHWVVVLQIGAAILCVGALALLGCSASATATPTSEPKSTAIDGGVVFFDRASYRCLPIEQIGLKADDQITSLHSSCECVQPRLVRYASSGKQASTAVLLEFVSDSEHATSDVNRSPAALGVIIKATLKDGRTHQFTVSFLHTHSGDTERH